MKLAGLQTHRAAQSKPLKIFVIFGTVCSNVVVIKHHISVGEESVQEIEKKTELLRQTSSTGAFENGDNRDSYHEHATEKNGCHRVIEEHTIESIIPFACICKAGIDTRRGDIVCGDQANPEDK